MFLDKSAQYEQHIDLTKTVVQQFCIYLNAKFILTKCPVRLLSSEVYQISWYIRMVKTYFGLFLKRVRHT